MTSIIITNYNYARYLERCLRSVLNQSEPPGGFEVIVVDDCSQDRSLQILKNFSSDIRYEINDSNQGLSYSRNRGVQLSRGQYVVFVDADDYVHKDFLYIERSILGLNPELDAVSCNYTLVDGRGNHIEHKNGERFPIACGIMFRKDLLFDIGLYDESFLAREEEELRKRWLQKHQIFNIPASLYRYRMHDSNLTKDEAAMRKGAIQLKEKHG